MRTLQRALVATIVLAAVMTAKGLGDDTTAVDEPGPNLLMTTLKDADVIFTGKIGKVQPLGQTNSIPASIFGKVTFREIKPLLGKAPAAPTFSYSHREGMTKNMNLEAKGDVLVAVKGNGVRAIVPATAANLALAKKFIAAP